MARTLILGVGNSILTDDAVGIRAARDAHARLGEGDRPHVGLAISERGGLDLVDLMTGYARVVVVDAIVLPDADPGTVVERTLEDFAITRHVYGAHGIGLPTAIQLGRSIGAEMPTEVHIVGITVADPYTVGESLTPAVARAVRPAAERVLAFVRSPPAGGEE